jgi:hypothetical protein
MALGVGELFIIGVVVLPVLLVIPLWWGIRRRTRRLGYSSIGDYLGAAPRTDTEKRDAAGLTLQGLVVCFLGIIWSPLVLVGLVPLFYGARKLIYASLGLGLVDDGELPPA